MILSYRKVETKKREIFVSCPFFWTTTNKDNKTKKEVAFRVSFSTCGAAFCVFFLPFFSFFCQNSIIFLPHKNPSASPTLFGHARRRRTKGPPSLSLFLSLFGVPFLSRSRARGAKNARARALNRTRRAGYSLAPVVGASELARSWGNRHRVLFARIQKREFCWFPVALVVGEKKGRKVSVTARSRARALLSRTDYLSIHRSIDRLEKKSKNGRVCARAAFWSRVAARRR